MYVFNFTDPQAADPLAAAHQTFALPAEEQAAITDGLADLGRVRFVADRVEVGVSGWVSCTAATWLTYVVERDGGQWWVTGTTGGRVIA